MARTIILPELFQADYGVPIECQCSSDISAGTSFFVELKRPDSTYVRRAATQSGTKPTKVAYTMGTRDFNGLQGKFDIRTMITFASRRQESKWASFEVGTSWRI